MHWKDNVWGVPTKRGGRGVYFTFLMRMKPEFKQWNVTAKDRFVMHFQREHASDTYSGNIDFNVYATDWGRDGVFGEGTFTIPEEYLEDFTKVSELKEVAEDAISQTLYYDLSPSEREMVKSYTVKITKG